jgi:hypothetical protein
VLIGKEEKTLDVTRGRGIQILTEVASIQLRLHALMHGDDYLRGLSKIQNPTFMSMIEHVYIILFFNSYPAASERCTQLFY